MSVWSAPSKSVRTGFLRLHDAIPFVEARPHNIAGAAILIAFAALVVVAYFSTLQTPNIGLRLGTCDGTPCAEWVIPGGHAWSSDVRTGMQITSVDDIDLTNIGAGVALPSNFTNATFIDSTGEEKRVAFTEDSLGESPLKFSFWVLGAMFAMLSAAVLIRRPDLSSARMFALFAGVSSLSLAVGPAAAKTGSAWTLFLQAVTLLGVGAFCFTFIATLVNYDSKIYRKGILPALGIVGGLLIIGYALAILVEPELYTGIRPAIFLYASASVIGAVTLALLRVIGNPQQSPTTRQQARLALAGIALGFFPFVGLTLIPEAIGQETLLPIYLTVLAVGLLPMLHAYAILQYQLMGIRKLVHRGMVYGLASVALLTVILIGLAVVFEVISKNSTTAEDFPIPVIAGIAVLGVVLFYPLRKGARWLVDRLVYGDVVDYRQLIEAMRRDLLSPGQTREVAEGITTILSKALHLESVLLFLGRSPDKSQLAAVNGDRGEEVLRDFYPGLESRIEESEGTELMELRWESDSVLLVPLYLPDKYCGYMLLGPKYNGEVFLEEEKQLITTIIPLLALTVDKSELSEELRVLNQRMLRAGETERARIATDIHDGPLQKAVLLAGVGGRSVQDSTELARFLVSELREVCSRLRPAILDDLGVVSALEWQLEQVMKRHGLTTELSLENLDDTDRFPPDVELAVFRITQEATNNAVKHAMCENLKVTLSREGDELSLEVFDNGIGFALTSRSDEGFGLSGMNERVMQLDGKFNILSVPGLGTTVTARIPIG